MRHLPRAARVAIATLYIRYRDDRRHTARARTDCGIGSTQALKAEGCELATWNALQSVIANVSAERSTLPTREFVRMVGLRGAAFGRKAA